eukprot:SAG31_NODE_203_length_20490_cov_7.713256_14_plen_526_part_00
MGTGKRTFSRHCRSDRNVETLRRRLLLARPGRPRWSSRTSTPLSSSTGFLQTEVMQVRSYFLVFVPTIREIRDFYRDMQRTNRESITMYSFWKVDQLSVENPSACSACIGTDPGRRPSANSNQHAAWYLSVAWCGLPVCTVVVWPCRNTNYVLNHYHSPRRASETLVVTAAHSGATPALPVIFKATGNVTWSGGVPLNGLSWQKDAASQAWSAKIQTPRSWRFESLYADEQRQWRARWPNGNPETYCARDLHGGHCPGYAQVGLNVSEATPCDPGECQVGSNRSNCNIFAAESGALIAEGTLRPLSAVHNLTVTTPNPSWHQRKKTFSTAAFYEKPRSPPSGMAPATAGSFQIDRFDTRFTKAFWNTAVAATLPIRPENFTDKTWAHPELAVAHVYQTEYWGIWMFQLQSVESDRILFSRGGWQEARGGSIGGRGGRGHQQDYFVENVPEELDAEREFYYNASTSTLYWIPRPSVNHPSESNLVAPAIEQLLSISANHIRFDGITFAHTLPTFMQPYEPTTGGDW